MSSLRLVYSRNFADAPPQPLTKSSATPPPSSNLANLFQKIERLNTTRPAAVRLLEKVIDNLAARRPIK